jgi:hypothetical protein
MSVPNTANAAQHSRHDRMLVARFAAGDAGAQEHEAQDLISRCPECAALAADISTISHSMAQLPATPRTQDFRLTADQADHLRGSRFDRWLRTLTGSGWTTVRPVAAVALSVGLVMSVVGVLPILGAAGTLSAPADSTFFSTTAPQVAAGQSVPPAPETRFGQDAASTPPSVAVPAATEQGSAHPPSDGGGSATAQSSPATTMDGAYNATPTDTPATQPNPILTQPTPEPSHAPGLGNIQPTTAPGGPSTDTLSPLPPIKSTASDVLLYAGIGVTVLAVLVLIGLYAARRRYDDPLLR